MGMRDYDYVRLPIVHNGVALALSQCTKIADDWRISHATSPAGNYSGWSDKYVLLHVPTGAKFDYFVGQGMFMDRWFGPCTDPGKPTPSHVSSSTLAQICNAIDQAAIASRANTR